MDSFGQKGFKESCDNCSGKVEPEVFGTADFGTDPETRGLVMDIFGYGRCSQCDEENFLADGSKCAACLGLVCR